MMAWWKWKQASCGSSCGTHPGGEQSGEGAGGPDTFASGDAFDADYGGGSFGVRRPLRFLSQKLDLDDKQVEELAHILSELKTERAQAAVDFRRTVAGLADAIAAETFDEAKASVAAGERVKSAERLRDAVVKAIGRIHALLRKEQRSRMAYLIRTGALTV
jgi:Spy/CpxP family protein refolding chaperone